jgi:hypothetical protein
MRAPLGSRAMIRYSFEPTRVNFLGVQHGLLLLKCKWYGVCGPFTHLKIPSGCLPPSG